MDHKEQHESQHKKERQSEKEIKNQREQNIELQEKKGWATPRPFGLMVIGIAITLVIVLGWIFFYPW
jgi:hypothetical protein